MDTPGTTVINGVSVLVDETDVLNVRLKVLSLDGAEILECGVDNGPKPDLPTTFPLPQALQASPLDHGALPNDPEELKQIITDLDFKLADCQRVAADEFQRLSRAHNNVNRDLRRAKEKAAQRANELNRRWQEEVSAHARSRKQMETVMGQDGALNELLAKPVPGISSRNVIRGESLVAKSQRIRKRVRGRPQEPSFDPMKEAKDKVNVLIWKARQLLCEAEKAAKEQVAEKLVEYYTKIEEVKTEIVHLHPRLSSTEQKQSSPGLTPDTHMEDKVEPLWGDDFIPFEKVNIKGGSSMAEQGGKQSNRDLIEGIRASVAAICKEGLEVLDELAIDASGDLETNLN